MALAAMQPTAVAALAASQSTPPFYLLTVWALVQIWGHGELVLRGLSWPVRGRDPLAHLAPQPPAG